MFALAAALILLRSAVWVRFEQSDFDSDQAIVGLMAKHLAEGRAFPLFYYGQHYMLAVEAWVAAPFLRLFGATVAILKLPLVAINIAIASVLLAILIRTLRLAPWQAMAATMFFILAPPLAAARLVEAQGSNIEPLLYVLLLWRLRERPLAFGALAGFAFLHREFAIYAIVGVVLLDAVGGRLRSHERWREYLMAWGMAALVFAAISLLKAKADLLGPGTAGTLTAPISAWSGLLCWPPTELALNLSWLFRENLGTLFNWKPDLLGSHEWTLVPVGHWWLAIALGAMTVTAAFEISRHRLRLDERWQFGAYLFVVAAQAAFAYAVLSCHVRDSSLIRYTLLTLLAPVGLVAIFFCCNPSAAARGVVVGAISLWSLCSFADTTRYLTAYMHRPAPNPYRELADFLEQQGVKYARAYYWTAYQLDYLTQERLTVASLDKIRVMEYQRAADQHEGQVVRIKSLGHCEEKSVSYRLWCFEELDRARGASQR